jgi:hypothetical protein
MKAPLLTKSAALAMSAYTHDRMLCLKVNRLRQRVFGKESKLLEIVRQAGPSPQKGIFVSSLILVLENFF